MAEKYKPDYKALLTRYMANVIDCEKWNCIFGGTLPILSSQDQADLTKIAPEADIVYREAIDLVNRQDKSVRKPKTRQK